MQIVVTCLREGGMIRGGIRHPRVAAYDTSKFSADQLREMIAEPDLVVVAGHLLTEAEAVTPIIQRPTDEEVAALRQAANEQPEVFVEADRPAVEIVPVEAPVVEVLHKGRGRKVR